MVQDVWLCDDCGTRWGPVSAPFHCPACGEAGVQDDESMCQALTFLNEHFPPWQFNGREPVAEALAALLRNTTSNEANAARA